MHVRRWVAATIVALGMVVTATAQPALAGKGAEHANVHATLIDVHVFGPAKGKPAPTTANCANAGATSASDYAFTGWVVSGNRVAHLNASTVPSSVSGAQAGLQAAFSAWSGSAGVPDFTVVADGTVTRQTANRGTDVMFGRVSGGSIAVTYTWRWSDGLIESDVVFNKSLSWRNLGTEGDGCYESQPYYDLQNIAAHEFGHVYGLDHPGGGRFESMYRYGYTGETSKRSPGAGDLAGISALY
jgi:hypothetical protein